MKNYIIRVLSGCKKRQLVYWWIMRALMVYALIPMLSTDTQKATQISFNLLGMFTWELMMLMPEKTFFRQIPSRVQDALIPGFFGASFFGAYLDYYYAVGWWDTFLHLLCGAGLVFIGYEIAVAMQKRDQKTAPEKIVLLCALGFSFMMSGLWEIGEFAFDQVFRGDTQHWSYELAVLSGSDKTLFDPLDPTRFALIDTMTDMVFNAVGAFAFYIPLRFYPYLHRGKHNINIKIEEAIKSAEADKYDNEVIATV
ncbi:MAG: hypothetical protein FWF05_01975 [Oscillospiraceae bacterium]|nr:hypothetical protein [Oscillospiraceae bacterium]